MVQEREQCSAKFRQAVNHTRAEPRDVIYAIKDTGLEVLSVAQVKNWWSTIHLNMTGKMVQNRMLNQFVKSKHSMISGKLINSCLD